MSLGDNPHSPLMLGLGTGSVLGHIVLQFPLHPLVRLETGPEKSPIGNRLHKLGQPVQNPRNIRHAAFADHPRVADPCFLPRLAVTLHGATERIPLCVAIDETAARFCRCSAGQTMTSGWRRDGTVFRIA